MEVKIYTECIMCRKKERVSIVSALDPIVGSGFMEIMKVKDMYVCDRCKEKRIELHKEYRLMKYKELFNKCKEYANEKGLVCVFFSRKLNKESKSVKFMHFYDPNNESGNPLLSVYYDEDCVQGGFYMRGPLYEMLHKGDISRYYTGEEVELFEKIKENIQEYLTRRV